MPFLAAALLTVAIAGDAPSTGSDPGPRWLGLTLGTAAVRYRQLLGDPLRVTPLNDPPERKARYLISRAPVVFLIVTERNGAVTGIEAFSDATLTAPLLGVDADPNGVRLGTAIAEVAAARPAARRYTDAAGDVHLQEDVAGGRGFVADYRFAHDRVVADSWTITSTADVPQLPGALPLAEAAGEGPSSAILDVQATDTAGVDWEYLYLRYHRCDGTAPWRPAGQSLQRANGRTYDVLNASCASTGTKRVFYFDITSFLGKS